MRQFPRWVRAALFLVALTLSGCSGGISGTDVEQPRLDTPAPRIEHQDALGQRFVATQPGLSGIEMILAVYPDPMPSGDLQFRLYDDQNHEIRRAALPLAALRHNDPVRFDFAPVSDSAGRQFTFTLSGPPNNPVTVWSNKDDVYKQGELLVDGQPQAGDLDFKTYVHLGYADILTLLWQDLLGGLGIIIPMLAVFFVPGYGLSLWLDRNRRNGLVKEYQMLWDLPGRFALSVGLSLAVWPLLFLLLSVTPIRLNSTVVWSLMLLVVAAIVAVQARRWRRDPSEASPVARYRALGRDDWLVAITFVAILVIIAALRALHVFGLAVPPWVDSIQHAVGVRLFTDSGRLPSTWGSDVYNVPFIYHFGFHSVTAVFTWLSGLSIPSAMLIAGQVMNTLVTVGVYLLTARLTGRRGAGLVAMTIVGTVSLMPAYYLTWGRYTQLTGLALLPAAAVLAFDAIDARPPVGRRIVLAGVAAGALFVTHYRVLLMYVALVGAYLVVETVAAVVYRRRFAPLWGRIGTVAALALVITLPWEARLAVTLTQAGSLSAWLNGSASFNTPHWGLLALGYQRELFIFSAIGALLAFWLRPKFVAVVLIATGVTVLVTNPSAVGLSSSWVFSNDSLIITAFLPLAMLTGYGAATVLGLVLEKMPGEWRPAVTIAGAVLLVGVALWTADGMLTVVNPVTVLATQDDVAAAAWIRDNVPQTARFLVNSRAWQEGAYAATDGGGWLSILANRPTTLPPISYAYSSSAPLIDKVTQTEKAVSEAASAETLAPLIQSEGATHIYIGAKGGALKPEMFLNKPGFRLLYSNGAAWVFEVLPSVTKTP
ncbi:MAG: DUF6541 family protein [Anaerolineae bacterium]